MSALEKYFMSQMKSHACQLPPSDDFEYLKRVRKIRNLFLISDKSLRSYLRMGTMSAIYFEKRRQLRTNRVLVVHPYSQFSRAWHFFICFFSFLCVIFFPVFSAFHGPFYARVLFLTRKNFKSFYTTLTFMFVLQLICFLEIFVNFMSGYRTASTNEIVLHRTKIARYYLSTYFFVDLLSALPIDMILVVSLGVAKYSQLPRYSVIIINIIPLLKFSCLKKLTSNFYSIFDYFSSSYSIYKMVLASFLYFLIIHWSACLMMLLPRWIHYKPFFEFGHWNQSSSWIVDKNLITRDLYHQYIFAASRSLACFSSAGFNLTSRQNGIDELMALLISTTGNIYWIVHFTVFLQLLSTLLRGRIRYLEMMDQVKRYMEQKKFPKALRKKILVNYVYLYRKEYVGEEQIFNLLSDNLCEEILLNIHQNFIKKIDLFLGLPPYIIADIVRCLKPEIYQENDLVYRAGEEGECMYFVSFGTLVVYSKDMKELDHIEDGNHFGEFSIIHREKRLTTIIAVEISELFKLERKDFAKLSKTYPIFLSKVEEILKERYNKYISNEFGGK